MNNTAQPSKQQTFTEFRNRFRQKTAEWQVYSEELKPLQREAAEKNGTPVYSLETQVVYNHALDDITDAQDIKLILIADNPGKDEQLAKNQRYLVGQAGKLGDGFFRRNPELGIDFRKNVIILNKTPVHTAKTKELQYLIRNGSPRINGLLEESQQWMAKETAALQKTLDCPLWLIGYTELRKGGLFTLYRDTLVEAYRDKSGFYTQDVSAAGNNFQGNTLFEEENGCNADDIPLYIFQHFSMNRFSIDLNEHYDDKISLKNNLCRLGLLHRREILGF